MTRTLQAIYERGILRPLEPVPFEEHQQVTVTVSDQTEISSIDGLEAEEDDSVTLEQVRSALSRIPGNLTDDIQHERDERF